MYLSKDREAAYHKKYRETHRESLKQKSREFIKDHPKKKKEYLKNNYFKKYPERYKIGHQMDYAYKMKWIIRPDECPRCGEKGRIHAHHFNYDHWRNFIWLCTLCHAKEHLKLKEDLRKE